MPRLSSHVLLQQRWALPCAEVFMSASPRTSRAFSLESALRRRSLTTILTYVDIFTSMLFMSWRIRSHFAAVACMK